MKYEPFVTMLPQHLSPQEESRLVRVSAALNVETALQLTMITSRQQQQQQRQPLSLTLDRLREQSRRTAGRKMS